MCDRIGTSRISLSDGESYRSPPVSGNFICVSRKTRDEEKQRKEEEKMKITLKDGSFKEYQEPKSVYEIAADISEGLARVATCRRG